MKHPGALGDGCTRGHNVVHQQHLTSGDLLFAGHGKGAANIFPALLRVIPTCDAVARRRSRTVVNNSNLTAARSPPSEAAAPALAAQFPDRGAGHQLRLVESPLAKLGGMQRHGDDKNRLRIEAGQQRLSGMRQHPPERARRRAHQVILRR